MTRKRSNITGKFQPLPDGTQLQRKQVMLRPDQVERLALEENHSATMRNALDAWWSTHGPPIEQYDYAAIDAAFNEEEGMSHEPANDLIERMERETGQRIDANDGDNMAMAGLRGAEPSERKG